MKIVRLSRRSAQYAQLDTCVPVVLEANSLMDRLVYRPAQLEHTQVLHIASVRVFPVKNLI